MRKFIYFILCIAGFLFAENDYWIDFHTMLNKPLTRRAFLFKMENFQSEKPGYLHFITKASYKYFNISFKQLTPVKLPEYHQKNQNEFVKYNHYGQIISTYMNVRQKGNNYNMSDKYQCSELVNRFYKKVFHIKVTQRNGIITAKEYNNLTGTFKGKPIQTVYYQVSHISLKVKPGGSFALKNIGDIKRKGNIYIYSKDFNNIFKKYPPVNGTVLSFANNFHSKSGIYFGHTAIVKKVVKIKNGYKIYCFEQNVIRKKSHTISINRYITFLKKNGRWIEIGSGILGPGIGRIGPVIGWSIPCMVNYRYIINKKNFIDLISELIDSKYFQLNKYKNKILDSLYSEHCRFADRALFNKTANNILKAKSLNNESFFEKVLSWF